MKTLALRPGYPLRSVKQKVVSVLAVLGIILSTFGVMPESASAAQRTFPAGTTIYNTGYFGCWFSIRHGNYAGQVGFSQIRADRSTGCQFIEAQVVDTSGRVFKSSPGVPPVAGAPMSTYQATTSGKMIAYSKFTVIGNAYGYGCTLTFNVAPNGTVFSIKSNAPTCPTEFAF